MGYYVSIKSSTARIRSHNLTRAYQKMCSLRYTHQHMMVQQGQYGHFSWMPQDYDIRCKTAKDVLELLGFEVTTNNHGDLLITGYDSKTGQEDLFLESICDDIEGVIHWFGEDGETWTFTGTGENIYEHEQSALMVLK